MNDEYSGAQNSLADDYSAVCGDYRLALVSENFCTFIMGLICHQRVDI